MSQTGIPTYVYKLVLPVSTIQWSLCFETKCHNVLSIEMNLKVIYFFYEQVYGCMLTLQ